MTNQNGRGLHDLLFKTQVVSSIQPKEEKQTTSKKQNNKKVVEAKYKEKSTK